MDHLDRIECPGEKDDTQKLIEIEYRGYTFIKTELVLLYTMVRHIEKSRFGPLLGAVRAWPAAKIESLFEEFYGEYLGNFFFRNGFTPSKAAPLLKFLMEEFVREGRENQAHGKGLIDTLRPTTFHQFMELPRELREKIWEMALPGKRIIEIQAIRLTKPTPNQKIYLAGHTEDILGPMMRTCTESQEMVLKRYSQIPAKKMGINTIPDGSIILFDPKTDALFCNGLHGIMLGLRLQGLEWDPAIMAPIKFLIITIKDSWAMKHSLGESMQRACLLKLPNLKQVVIAVQEREEWALNRFGSPLSFRSHTPQFEAEKCKLSGIPTAREEWRECMIKRKGMEALLGVDVTLGCSTRLVSAHMVSEKIRWLTYACPSPKY
jgi:hypothetical protein